MEDRFASLRDATAAALLRGEGATPAGLEVAFLFNIYDRMADAMGWDVPPLSGGYYRMAAPRLLKHGYL